MRSVSSPPARKGNRLTRSWALLLLPSLGERQRSENEVTALGWRRQKVLLGSDKSRGGTTSVTQMMIGSYQLLPKTK